MDKSVQANIQEISDDIFLKLDNIHQVIGYLLEKTKGLPEPISVDKIISADNINAVQSGESAEPPVLESNKQ
jgi:hypothetical protein